MSLHSPRNSQSFRYDGSTPPPPPPKPSTHSSGQVTPLAGPPKPPPPPGTAPGHHDEGGPSAHFGQHESAGIASAGLNAALIQPPGDGWLPSIVKDKTTLDLHNALSDPSIQQALIHSHDTAHKSLPASAGQLNAIISENVALATTLKKLEAQIQHQRQSTQSRLLSLRALERQWQAKQAEQDAALRDFSPPALYQRLSGSVGEQEALCRGLEESFLEGEGGGAATEREVGEFVRRIREARKTAYLRRERKERWDEGRVGGWR